MIEGIPGTPFEDEVLIRRCRWSSDETGFAIVDADREGDEITLVGTIAHLEERERVRISGEWQDDQRYGLQVKVATAEPLAPTGEAALLVYLKRVRHVGGRRAERLLELYGEDVLEVIDHDPRAAFRRLGLSAGRITEAVKSWDELRSSRALHLLLAPHGLAWLVARIETPLRPARPPRRARAPLRPHERVRHRVPDRGHDRALGRHPSRLTRAHARGSPPRPERGGARRLDLPPGRRARHARRRAARHRAGRQAVGRDGRRRRARHRAQQGRDGRAHRRARRARLGARSPSTRALPPRSGSTAPRRRSSSTTSPRSSRELAAAPASLKPSAAPPADDLVPAPEQAAAVRAAFASRLSIVTGGPGTGKTATIRLICAAASRAEGVDPPRRPDRPSRPPHVRVERPRRLDRPLRARLDPRPGPDRRRARHRPPDRRRDLDGQPRAARHAPRRRRPARPTSSSSATPTSSRRSEPASRSPSSSRPARSRSPSSPTSSARPPEA